MISRTIEYLTDPMLRGVYLPGVATAFAVSIMCSLLSPLVVLKRLSFVGQGVSHAAFGGVGVAMVLSVIVAGFGGGVSEMLAGDLGMMVVVAAFCIASALIIAWLTDRSEMRADTAIGIVLVASMAIGFLLLQQAGEWRLARRLPPAPSLESVLFGSIFEVSTAAAALAWIISGGVAFTCWAVRRRLVFWAFDEASAEAFGVRTGRIKVLVMVLLALAIVMTMKLAGLILATALLVLPGAAAVHLSRRGGGVIAWSVGLCLISMVVGLVLAFELNLQPGPSVVVVLTVIFAAARGVSALRTRSASAVSPA